MAGFTNYLLTQEREMILIQLPANAKTGENKMQNSSNLTRRKLAFEYQHFYCNRRKDHLVQFASITVLVFFCSLKMNEVKNFHLTSAYANHHKQTEPVLNMMKWRPLSMYLHKKDIGLSSLGAASR